MAVLGANFTAEGCVRDQKIMIGRAWALQHAFDLTAKSWDIQWIRLQRKAGLALFRYLALENRWQLGYGVDELMSRVIDLKPDLVIAHWEVALSVCGRLIGKGVNIGIDMEDWFSEDLLPEAQKQRPIQLLKKLESLMLCKGVWSTCTSEVMADALVKAYGCRKPVVIRNVFPAKDRMELDGQWKDRPEMTKWMIRNDPQAERPQEAPVSIHWFSQTIGPGRGLEELFVALEGLGGGWELHLRGNLKGYEKWLDEVCPSGVAEKTRIHSPVSNEELPSRIAEHDIGYAGENKTPENRNLTITNKFFQYLNSGLAVIASDTAGQVEGAREAKGAVFTFKAGSEEAVRNALKSLVEKRGGLVQMRQRAWEAGYRLCWEKEAEKYQGMFSWR